jgi:alginate O-acetyltransferase complex protein AlgI
MLFNSFIFLLLLAVTFLIYYIPLLRKHQIQVLILSSLTFYAYGQPQLLLLLLTSAFINILTSYYIVQCSPGKKKMLATLGVVLNLSILIFFKYSPLFARTFFNVNGGFGIFLLTIPLPIGISFYTFEGISLLVDVYSNKHADVLTIDRSFKSHVSKTLFFISFFPHLIAGPILKAYEFYPQIGPKNFADIDWIYVFKKLTVGYFLKMVIADNLTNFTFWMAYPFFKSASSMDLILMVFAYSCQIFADFAGYSLIALGVAKLFGYDLISNFNFPYISASFSEFWRCWHISLSTFLKEYLYIPLGGNRKGSVRTYINLTVTMVLGGLWHGAALSYAIWGLFHGIALAVERFVNNRLGSKSDHTAVTVFKMLCVFLFVSTAWILFKMPFSDVIEYMKSIFTNYDVPTDKAKAMFILIYSLPVIAYHIFYLLHKHNIGTVILKKYEYVIYSVLLFMIAVNSGPTGSFIYFQF